MISVGAHALALALLAVDVLVRGARMRLLTGDDRIALHAALAINAVGDAAAAVTPARLGGEPARFVALGRYRVRAGVRVVALAAERIVDLVLVTLVGVVALGLLGGRGFADVAVIARRLTTGAALPWLVAVGGAVLVSAVVALRLRHRLPAGVHRTASDALHAVRRLPPATLILVVGLSLVSMGVRVAILPVLLAGAGVQAANVTTLIGSFALVYAQLLLPTPAGAGGVELGFVAGVAPLLGPTGTAAALLAWRGYTLVIPVALGAGVWATMRAAAPTPGG